MKLNDRYDWIVLGDHPGALLSASLAARLGLSVLVLPMGSENSMGVVVSRSGQVLDPESNYLLGLSATDRAQGLLLESFNRLGVTSGETSLIQKENLCPQIATPKKRVAFNAENDQLLLEILREFGKSQSEKLGLVETMKHSEKELLAYWLGLPKRLMVSSDKSKKAPEPMSLREVYRRLSRSAHLPQKAWLSSSKSVMQLDSKGEWLELLSGFTYAVTGTVLPKDLPLSEITHLIALSRTGAAYQGGITAFRDFLIRLARRLGAHIPSKTSCRRIFIENGRFAGVQMANWGSMIGARSAVLGCSLAQAKDKMSMSGRSVFRHLKAGPQPTGWKFSIGLSVRKEAIPPGMSRRLVWQQKDAPVFEIELAQPGEYGAKDLDHELVFLRTVLPFTQESLSVEYQRMIAARMLRKANELIPYLEFHVTRIYPDFRDVSSHHMPAAGTDVTVIDELSEMYGFAMPELIPDNLRCFSGEGIGSNSGIEGLYVASAESFPRLGSMGGTVAAIESVAAVAHRSGLPGPFA